MKIMGKPNFQEKESLEEPDGSRISDLPDELLEEILSSVSMDEAVATSILSRRWEKVWTTLPYLNFDFRKYPKDEFLRLIDGTLDKYIKKTKFTYIPRFTLRLGRCDYMLKDYVDGLAQRLTKCNIKEFIFCQDLMHNYYFPQSILMVKSITVLRLTGCDLGSVIADDIEFVSLKILSLHYVEVSDLFIERILNTSLDLEELSIEYCEGFESIRVNNLSRLNIIRLNKNEDLKMVCIDAPTLEHFFHKGIPCVIWFNNCSNLRVCLEKDEKLIDRLAPLNNLKYLKLHFSEVIEIPVISSSSLTSLELSFCVKMCEADVDTPNLQFLKLSGQKISSISLNAPPKLKAELDFSYLAIMGLKEYIDLLNLLGELNEPKSVTLFINVHENEIIPEEWIVHFASIKNLTRYRHLWLGTNIGILDGIRMVFPNHNIQFQKPFSWRLVIIPSVWVEVKKQKKVPVNSKKKALHFNPTISFEANELTQVSRNTATPSQNDSKLRSNGDVTLANMFQCLLCDDL